MVSFITPVQLTLTQDAEEGYETVDLSASIPVGGTGAILRVVNTSTTDKRYHIRHPSSTQDALYQDIQGDSHTWDFSPVDSSRQLAVKRETTDIKVYLWGYFESEANFFTNPTEDSFTGTFPAWKDWDISGLTGGDTAIAVIVTVAGTARDFSARKKGSSDSLIEQADNRQPIMIGCDSSEIFQIYAASADERFFVIGYVKSGVSMYTSAIQITGLTGGIWNDYTLPAGSTGAILWYTDPRKDPTDKYGARKNGTSEAADDRLNESLGFAVTEAASEVIEVYVQSVSNTSVYLLGVTGTPTENPTGIPVIQGYYNQVRRS